MNARTTLSNRDLSRVGGRAKIMDTKWEIRDRASLSCKSSWGLRGVGRGRWVENAEGGSQVPWSLVISKGLGVSVSMMEEGREGVEENVTERREGHGRENTLVVKE